MAAGRTIYSGEVMVGSPSDGRVSVYRGAARTDHGLRSGVRGFIPLGHQGFELRLRWRRGGSHLQQARRLAVVLPVCSAAP